MEPKSVDTAKSAIHFFYELEEKGHSREDLIEIALYLAVIFAMNDGHVRPEKLLMRLLWIWRKTQKMGTFLRWHKT